MAKNMITNKPLPKQGLSQKSSFGAILAGFSGLALIAILLLPWFSWINSGITLSDASGSHAPKGAMSIWQATPGLGYLVLCSGVIAASVALFKMISRKNPPAWTGPLLIVTGMLSIGYMFIVVLSPPTQVSSSGTIMMNNVSASPAIGLWLGSLAAIGIISGGLLVMRE